jgi:NADH-quinone oxidoreductase subunit G
LNDWTIEGPREMDKDSVITANKYELPVVSPAVNVDAKFVSE